MWAHTEQGACEEEERDGEEEEEGQEEGRKEVQEEGREEEEVTPRFLESQRVSAPVGLRSGGGSSFRGPTLAQGAAFCASARRA